MFVAVNLIIIVLIIANIIFLFVIFQVLLDALLILLKAKFIDFRLWVDSCLFCE